MFLFPFEQSWLVCADYTAHYHGYTVLYCSYVLPEACVSPRLICVAVLGLLALCIGRLVPALAAFSVPVDVPHCTALWLGHGQPSIGHAHPAMKHVKH